MEPSLDRDKRQADLLKYIMLLEAAFDELHAAVLAKLADPKQYVGVHSDHPVMTVLDSGFPSIHKVGLYNDRAPKDYVGTVRRAGIIGLLMFERPKENFPAGEALVEYLRTTWLGKKLDMKPGSPGYFVDGLLAEAVECYLHRHGTGPINTRLREPIVRRIFLGTVLKTLGLRVVVPIALTHFAVDHFRFSENAYLTRLTKPLQLARSRIKDFGSGAADMVVGAATHAFVATGWTIENESVSQVRHSLEHPSTNVLDLVDRFFAALRTATGASTGFAQVLFLPRGWATSFYCDLPPVFGATYRRYPNTFDDYAWARGRSETVTREQLQRAKQVFERIVLRDEERVLIAIKRLNACLTRDDPVDAILDATIGLEVLLGDGDSQALSYKLRMRAGALGGLKGDRDPAAVAKDIKTIYGIRSKIVHGVTGASKRVEADLEQRYEKERALAADLLRYVLSVLIEFPRYLEPDRIDVELMLGVLPLEPPPPKKPRKPMKPRSAKRPH